MTPNEKFGGAKVIDLTSSPEKPAQKPDDMKPHARKHTSPHKSNPAKRREFVGAGMYQPGPPVMRYNPAPAQITAPSQNERDPYKLLDRLFMQSAVTEQEFQLQYHRFELELKECFIRRDHAGIAKATGVMEGMRTHALPLGWSLLSGPGLDRNPYRRPIQSVMQCTNPPPNVQTNAYTPYGAPNMAQHAQQRTNLPFRPSPPADTARFHGHPSQPPPRVAPDTRRRSLPQIITSSTEYPAMTQNRTSWTPPITPVTARSGILTQPQDNPRTVITPPMSSTLGPSRIAGPVDSKNNITNRPRSSLQVPTKVYNTLRQKHVLAPNPQRSAPSLSRQPKIPEPQLNKLKESRSLGGLRGFPVADLKMTKAETQGHQSTAKSAHTPSASTVKAKIKGGQRTDLTTDETRGHQSTAVSAHTPSASTIKAKTKGGQATELNKPSETNNSESIKKSDTGVRLDAFKPPDIAKVPSTSKTTEAIANPPVTTKQPEATANPPSTSKKHDTNTTSKPIPENPQSPSPATPHKSKSTSTNDTRRNETLAQMTKYIRHLRAHQSTHHPSSKCIGPAKSESCPCAACTALIATLLPDIELLLDPPPAWFVGTTDILSLNEVREAFKSHYVLGVVKGQPRMMVASESCLMKVHEDVRRRLGLQDEYLMWLNLGDRMKGKWAPTRVYLEGCRKARREHFEAASTLADMWTM